MLNAAQLLASTADPPLARRMTARRAKVKEEADPPLARRMTTRKARATARARATAKARVTAKKRHCKGKGDCKDKGNCKGRSGGRFYGITGRIRRDRWLSSETIVTVAGL